MTRRIVIVLLAVAAIPTLGLAQDTSPYADQDARTIKALSPSEINGYLAGEGLGMAKAGELNHYPGPKHVLAMADRLALSEDQRRAIGKVAAGMTAAAVPLGRQIVDAEAALDRAFADRTVDSTKLAALTGRIADLGGRLRAVHLSAHLATRHLLTEQQIAAYDAMRGYGAGEMPTHHHGR